jgi:hypothetical protein
VPRRRSYSLANVVRLIVVRFPTWPECHADHVDCGMLESLSSLGSRLGKKNIKGHVSACLNIVLKDMLLR